MNTDQEPFFNLCLSVLPHVVSIPRPPIEPQMDER